MIDKLRKFWRADKPADERGVHTAGEPKRTHNLFEAAAVYTAACAEDDQDEMDRARQWVSPEALSFGLSELACRAVIALARERDQSPHDVARSLMGLPAA